MIFGVEHYKISSNNRSVMELFDYFGNNFHNNVFESHYIQNLIGY